MANLLEQVQTIAQELETIKEQSLKQQQRIRAIELRLSPKRTGDSELLTSQALVDLLVDILPTETIDLILRAMHNDKEGWCDFCFKDDGQEHGFRCPSRMFQTAREMKQQYGHAYTWGKEEEAQ